MSSTASDRISFVPRLVALDLDGTCLDKEQRLHPRTEAAIRDVIAKQVHVVLATGRMYRSALGWARVLGIVDPLICYQGAIVRKMPDTQSPTLNGVSLGALLVDESLEAGTAQALLELARSHGWHRQAYADERLLCEEDRPEAREYARIAQVDITFVSDLAQHIAGTPKFICVIHDRPEAAHCEDAMRAVVGTGALVTRSLPQFVEATSPRASKGQALRAVCGHLGVPLEHTVAIGDAANDIDMLAASGYAVAVDTGPPELFAVADTRCAPPTLAGVADVLDAVCDL